MYRDDSATTKLKIYDLSSDTGSNRRDLLCWKRLIPQCKS